MPAPVPLRSSLRAFGLRSAIAMCALSILLACQSDEEKIASFIERAEAYVEEEQHKEAIIEYRNVLQIDPNHAQAHYELAKSYLVQRKGKEAYWELSEAVRLDGSNTDARLTLGGLALIAKDFEESLTQADATIELAPEEAASYVLRGQALEQLDRAEEAEAPYLKAIEAAPDDGAYLLVLAGYYVRMRDRAAAEPVLVKFTEVEPGFPSYTSLARFLAADRERDETTLPAFEKALETAEDSTRAGAYQNLANFLFSRERGEDAVAVLQKGIDGSEEGSKQRLDLTYLLARFHRSRGDEAKADALIESATSAQPGDVKPHLILSAYRGRKGDLEGALEAANAALAVDPEHAKARLRKAELLVDMGYRTGNEAQIAEGAEIVDAVLAEEPTSPDALFVKGKVFLTGDDPAASVTSLRAALDSRPNWSQAHFVLGSALTLVGDTTAARAEVARAVELDASLLEARRLLAKLHASLGEHEYAVEQGRVYLREQPDHDATRILVAQSLLRLGRREAALAELDRIPEDRWTAEVLFAMGRVRLLAGETGPGHDYLLRADALNPNHPEILKSLLSVESSMGKLDESAARIAAAIAAKPDDAPLRLLGGRIAVLKGDFDAAEQEFEKAIELEPTKLAGYQQLANLYQSAGRIDETLSTYQKALEQRPDSAQLHHFVAVLYEMGGKIDLAMEEYTKAVELQPNFGQAKNNLAYLLAERGEDLDRALELAQQAKAIMPESPNAADTLGWVLYKRGISSAAVGYLKEAEAGMDEQSPSLGIVRHHLALAYEANEEPDKAIESLEQALSGLEQQMAAARQRGAKPSQPEWSADARAMLVRLKPAG